MKHLGTALLAALLLLGGGCRPRTQIMIGVLTDLRAPDLLDEVELIVRVNGEERVFYPWIIPGAIGQREVLPGSFGIYSSDGSEQKAEIFLTGMKNGNPRVTRRARVSLVREQTLFMRMALVQGCVSKQDCLPDVETCIEGACRPIDVDARRLPAYSPELVRTVMCTTGTNYIDTETGQLLPVEGSCGAGESCEEGTCYKPILDSDGNPILDGGIQQGLWTQQTVPTVAAMRNIHAVWGTSSGDAYHAFAVGQNGVIMHLHDPGAGPQALAWLDESPPGETADLFGVFGTSPTDVWAVGKDVIYHRGSGDPPWTRAVTSGLGAFELHAVHARDPGAAVAVGRDDTKASDEPNGFALSWDGVSWRRQTLPQTARDLRAVTDTPGGALAVGLGGTLIRSTGPDSWTDESSQLGAARVDLFGVVSVGEEGYAVGQAGTIIHRRANGGTVEESRVATDLLGVWASSDLSHVYAVGRDGTILYSRGDGNWMSQPSGTTRGLNGVFGLTPNDLYAVGDGATLLFSRGATSGAPQSGGGGPADR